MSHVNHQIAYDLKSSRLTKRQNVVTWSKGPEHLRLAGVDLLARVDGADAADAGHGQGVQGAAGQAALVEEAPRAQRPLHRPAEGVLAHWILYTGKKIMTSFVQK